MTDYRPEEIDQTHIQTEDAHIRTLEIFADIDKIDHADSQTEEFGKTFAETDQAHIEKEKFGH